MKKGLIIFCIIITYLLFLPYFSYEEDIGEYVNRVYKVNLPKADIIERLIDDHGFQYFSVFQISSYNYTLDSNDLQDLKKITEDKIMDARLEYVRTYDHFSEEEQKIIDHYFDRFQKITADNYYSAKKREGRWMFVLYDQTENRLYYLVYKI